MDCACKDCGTVAEPKTAARGYFWVEVVLWLCFLVPGLIYSVWRVSSKHEVCRKCGSAQLVPLDTPKGRELATAAGHVPVVVRPSPGAVSFGRSIGRVVGKLRRK